MRLNLLQQRLWRSPCGLKCCWINFGWNERPLISFVTTKVLFSSSTIKSIMRGLGTLMSSCIFRRWGCKGVYCSDKDPYLCQYCWHAGKGDSNSQIQTWLVLGVVLVDKLCAWRLFNAVFMVKSQAESDLQGGDCEDMCAVLGTKLQSRNRFWILVQIDFSWGVHLQICCWRGLEVVKFVRLLLENFQNKKAGYNAWGIIFFSFISSSNRVILV